MMNSVYSEEIAILLDDAISYIFIKFSSPWNGCSIASFVCVCAKRKHLPGLSSLSASREEIHKKHAKYHVPCHLRLCFPPSWSPPNKEIMELSLRQKSGWMAAKDLGCILSRVWHLRSSADFLVTWSNVKLVQRNETSKQIFKMLNVQQINNYKLSYPKAIKYCYTIKIKQFTLTINKYIL